MYHIKQLTLALGDFLAFSIGLWLSVSLRSWGAAGWPEINTHLGLFIGLFLLWLIINYINGLYDLDRQGNTPWFYRRLAETAVFSFIVSIIFFYLFPPQGIAPKTILLLNIIIGYGLATLWRLLYNSVVRHDRVFTKVIFVGYAKETQELIDLLARHPEKGYRAVVLIDPTHEVKPATLPTLNVYHSLQTVRPSITNHHADLVVVAPHLRQDTEALRELYELLFWPIHITDLSAFYEQITGRIPPLTFSEGWFLEHLRAHKHPFYDRLRTLIDYGAILLMGIVFVILLPFIALAIKLNSAGPIFIRQRRIGYAGKIFTMYKFRTMYALSLDGTAEVDGVQFAKKNDSRITIVGKILRKTRLDELPQAWNLLRREITLIGPRPERPEIVEKLQKQMPYYPLRHMVRPGLTGWALINQNYTDNYETSLQKLQYDLYYIKNRSWILDTVIMLRTINVIIRLMGQ